MVFCCCGCCSTCFHQRKTRLRLSYEMIICRCTMHFGTSTTKSLHCIRPIFIEQMCLIIRMSILDHNYGQIAFVVQSVLSFIICICVCLPFCRQNCSAKLNETSISILISVLCEQIFPLTPPLRVILLKSICTVNIPVS